MAQPVQAQALQPSNAISYGRDGNRPAKTLQEWRSQIDAVTVAITQIRLNPTETGGLEIILETQDNKVLLVDATKFRAEGSTLIAEISSTVLALPNGQAFNADNPTDEVAIVRVVQLDAATIRITVTGKTALPTQEVVLKTGSFAYSLNPEAGEPDEEIVVTGERQRGYVVPNATTATRTDTSILDTPQSIQVIPQQIFRDQQIIRVDDALRNVSNVVGRLNPFGASTSLTIRGFTADNFTAGAILRDGFRVTDNLGTQETANIERIEVLKGPSSVLYGQNDPGGIINLVTKRPLADPFYKLEFQAGSFGLIRPSIDISGPLTDDRGLRYRLNLAYQRETGFRDFTVNTERFFIAPVLSWDISEQTNLSLVLEYTDEKNPFDLGLPALGNRVANVPRNRVIGDRGDFLNNRALTLGYDLKHKINSNWTLNHGLRYVTQNYNVFPALPFFVDQATGDVTLFFADREYRSDDYSIQTNVVGKFETGSIRHTLLAGIDLNFNRFDEQFTRVDFTTPLILNIFNPVYGTVPRPDLSAVQPFAPFDTEYDRIGVFLQDQVAFSDSFILVGSLRYDSINFRIAPDYDPNQTNRSDQVWSPRIGLIYKPVETVSLYTNYAQSFKPNFGRTAAGSPLEAEKSRGFEIGAKTELLNGKMFLTLAYFDIAKQNVATPDPTNPFFSVTTGEQLSQGVELDVAGEILPGWNIIASYAYTDARVTRDNNIPVGNRLFNAPFHSAGLWTTYEIQQGELQGLGFGFGINYVGSRFGDLANSFELGDYLLTNLALFYKRDRWRLGLNINNLFDVNYTSSSFNGRNFGNAPGAPFNVIGTLAVEF
ncbi:TonB-dependent siderophore receptor [Leptolyngbya sp. 'hensonii']|uniref:TonB-dependent siderophore receptor n=1 Tax=Leptolyngbya sp. 'hensonii' TaxID=1922337 RepID=UPI00209B0095|nr:TonB-dependent siderophore receptor [Leptolyngbya sp. 'hensonii']